ncbi:HAD-IA family hydrolase [Vibrio fluvialis]|uniref:HAD-IA family hydrolase n=1 Tax=Vibrio fluvialis TaxID=676 RepID=UPI003BA2E9F7
MNGSRSVRGAVEFLDQLPDENWAIFTSAPRKLAVAKLKAASIPIPEVLITVEDVTKGKPNPEGYILAASKLNAVPSECLVFEDASAGIYSALSAGCDVINITSAAPEIINIEGVDSIEDYYSAQKILEI